MENENIGIAHQIPEFDQKIAEIKEDWIVQTESKKVNLSKITSFLLTSTDILICTIDNLLDKGIDKKITVLMGIEQIYSLIQNSPCVPIWLKPFLGVIKTYIIYTVLSASIDWMVAKYKQGSWNKKQEKKETVQIKKRTYNKKKK